MTNLLHPLDLATNLELNNDGLWLGHTQPAYGNMVGPFGGVTSAVMLNAVLKHQNRLGDPVSLTVNFAGPIEDGPFTIQAQALRTNRSTQHWFMTLFQHDGQIATTASAVFAIRRETWHSTELNFPVRQPALDLARADTSKAPEWTRRYDMRTIKGLMIDGQQPSQEPDAITEFWIQDDPPRPLDFFITHSHLRLICAPYFRAQNGQISSWYHFSHHAFPCGHRIAQFTGTNHVLGIARASKFGLGYHDQSAEIWSDQQQLLATSHQVVYYKA